MTAETTVLTQRITTMYYDNLFQSDIVRAENDSRAMGKRFSGKQKQCSSLLSLPRRDREKFTCTFAISGYRLYSWGFDSYLRYNRIESNLSVICGSQVFASSPNTSDSATNKTDRHDISYIRFISVIIGCLPI